MILRPRLQMKGWKRLLLLAFLLLLMLLSFWRGPPLIKRMNQVKVNIRDFLEIFPFVLFSLSYTFCVFLKLKCTLGQNCVDPTGNVVPTSATSMQNLCVDNSAQVSSKLKLQLFPFDEISRQALERVDAKVQLFKKFIFYLL